MIAAVDTDALFELVWAAPAAVLLVTISWGLVIRGATHAFEAQRAGRPVATGFHIVVAVLGLAIFSAALIAGLLIMLDKD